MFKFQFIILTEKNGFIHTELSVSTTKKWARNIARKLSNPIDPCLASGTFNVTLWAPNILIALLLHLYCLRHVRSMERFITFTREKLPI